MSRYSGKNKGLQVVGGIVVGLLFVGVIACVVALCYGSATGMTFTEVWQSLLKVLKGGYLNEESTCFNKKR